jgi:hypothetical protein
MRPWPPGEQAVASSLAAVLTEIYLCASCSCHEMLRSATARVREEERARRCNLTAAAAEVRDDSNAPMTAPRPTDKRTMNVGRPPSLPPSLPLVHSWGLG